MSDFDYHGRGADRHGQRRVHPQQLFHYRSNWFLSAWCVDREDLRTFSVDRIRHPHQLDERAEDLAPEKLDRYLRGSFGIFTGTAEAWAVLRFSAYAARWVADESWHPDQLGQWLPDGRWELQVPYADPTELIREVLRHGPEVEVVAPAELREEVRVRLQAALGQYR